MIKSFRNPAARAAWDRRYTKGVPADVVRVAHRKLPQVLLPDRSATSRRRLATASRPCAGTARASTASGSTTSGGSACAGRKVTRTTSRSSTTTG